MNTPVLSFQPVSQFKTTLKISVERHGSGRAIYYGRDQNQHGANLGLLTECSEELARQVEQGLVMLSRHPKGLSPSFHANATLALKQNQDLIEALKQSTEWIKEAMSSGCKLSAAATLERNRIVLAQVEEEL